MIHVNNPIITYCKGAEEGSTSRAVDLRGSNFHYSNRLDYFSVHGCNYHVEMANIEPLLIGCNTSCTPATSTSNGSCNSAPKICSCINTIPTNLEIFNVTFQSIAAAAADDDDDDCGYAYISGYVYRYPNLPTNNSGYGPASLEWGLHNETLEAAERLRNQENDPSFYCTVPYKELEVATDHFNKNRILGQGGQGTVYKGMLPDGTTAAVKRSNFGNEGKFVQQFINEVVVLSQINHRHVVKLLGCCLETEVPLLIYEFVPNGTLFQYLHNQNEECTISWEMRLQIATEVAGALSYLHSAASVPIYHRDIKSTNILLDDKYKTKVADFGTSRSVAIDQTHLTTLVHGTFGYLDPEYYHSSQFTDKSDVYSFGVVLVELLTGQKPVCSMWSEEYRSLVTYFLVAMEENYLFNILDAPVLKEGDKIDEIVGVANLARRCLHSHGRIRPTMREVTIELEKIRVRSNAQHSNYQEIDHLQQQQPNGDVTSSFIKHGVDSFYVALSVAAEP